MMALQESELQRFANRLGAQATIVTSAIARLHLASPDPLKKKQQQQRLDNPDSVLQSFPNLSDKEWTFSGIMGALLFVIDRELDTFVFQLYDLKTDELRFEYELYLDIDYTQLDEQFHSFEMEDCVAGFSFADSIEAGKFFSKVRALRPTHKTHGQVPSMKSKSKRKGFFGRLLRSSASKDDIEIEVGDVVNVKHEAHVGLNEDGTFDLSTISPQWKEMFRRAGIRKRDLKDPETAVAIMQTIQQTEMNETYKALPEYEEYELDELEQLYTPEQREQFEQYQLELQKYEMELEAYKAESEALAQWERENKEYLKKKREEEERFTAMTRALEKEAATKAAPPLPPRKGDKELKAEAKRKEKEIRQAMKSARIAEKQIALAERKLRKSMMQHQQHANLDTKRPTVVEDDANDEDDKLVVEHETKYDEKDVEDEIVEEEIDELQAEQEKLQSLPGLEDQRDDLELAHEGQVEELDVDQQQFGDVELEHELEQQQMQPKHVLDENVQVDEAADEDEDDHPDQSSMDMDGAVNDEEGLDEEALKYKRALEEAKRQAEEARAAAERAERERNEILAEIARMKELNAANANKVARVRESNEKTTQKANATKQAKPSPPGLPPLPEDDTDETPIQRPQLPPNLPPPPKQATEPPKPPTPPELPELPPGAPRGSALLSALSKVKLRQTSIARDASAPDVTGRRGRPKSRNFLGQIEEGVVLRHVERHKSRRPSGAGNLPDLENMNNEAQNSLMEKLVATMQRRRAILKNDDEAGGEVDSSDEWSD